MPALPAPISFYLELTAQCNNHCPGCGNVFVQRGKQDPGVSSAPLPASEWQRILAALQPHTYRLKITGGEPTLHPEFEAIVEHLGGLDVPFTLFTNGRWARPQRTLDLLRRTPCLEGLLISLHGVEATSHEAFNHTPGSFGETLATIEAVRAAGLPFSLSCIITRHNWNRVDVMLALSRRLGADSVVFNRYLGRDRAGVAPGSEQLRAAATQIATLRAAGAPVKLGNCLPACFGPGDQAGCLAGLAFCTVDPWGRVRPCNHAALDCGSLLESSLEEVWQSAAMRGWRETYPAECVTCPALATCRGGCRAQAMSLGQPADPLATGRLPEWGAAWTTMRTMRLYEQARPTAIFERREQPFGCLLLAGNRVVAVGEQLEPALSLLDGATTLRQIQTAHGSAALSLVALLYYQGLVNLQN